MAQRLNWSRFEGLVRFPTVGDGSCLIHAIAYAYFKPYRLGVIKVKTSDGKETHVALNRREMIASLRQNLAARLESPIDFDQTDAAEINLLSNQAARAAQIPQSTQAIQSRPILYDTLCNGNLKSFSDGSEILKDYTLEAMKNRLLNDRFDFMQNDKVENSSMQVYIELLGTLLNKDIYLLEKAKRDVYVLCGPDDMNIYWKERPSIVILFDQQMNHFETVGLEQNDDLVGTSIITHFSPNHKFIMALRDRIAELHKLGSKRNK